MDCGHVLVSCDRLILGVGGNVDVDGGQVVFMVSMFQILYSKVR